MGWLSWCIKDLWGTKVVYCYVVKSSILGLGWEIPVLSIPSRTSRSLWSNRPRQQIEAHPNNWQYPLINYLEFPKLRSKRSTEPSHHVTKSILESTIEDVFEVEQQTVKSRVKRNDIIYDLEFNDPYWSKMWYLNRFGHFIFSYSTWYIQFLNIILVEMIFF